MRIRIHSPDWIRMENFGWIRIQLNTDPKHWELYYIKGLVNSKDNITEQVAAQEQAYEVVTQEVDVGGI